MKKLEKLGILIENLEKYVVDYEVMDDHIKVLANNGDYRIVKNTKKNIDILNKTIVKNKVSIAKRIDSYERHSTERLIILLFTIFLVAGCGALIPFSFFTGSYILFLASILVFSIAVIFATISGFNLYMLIRDIQSLKRATGYKQAREFSFRDLNKSHN